MNKLFKILMVVLVAIALGTSAAVLVEHFTFPMNGRVKLIGVDVVWADTNEPFLGYQWDVDNGTATLLEAPLKVTLTENVPATLALDTWNLTESIIALVLEWNYTGEVLQPNDSVIVELTQTINATKTEWSYTMVIAATEVPP